MGCLVAETSLPGSYLEIPELPQTRPQWGQPGDQNNSIWDSTLFEDLTSSSWARARASRTKPVNQC